MNQTPTLTKPGKTISFRQDVFPIISKNCLPCHAEDNFNPSELSLDSYELLMEGGKHGPPVVAGNAKESLIVRKTGLNPPFGDRMPLNSKQKIESGNAKWLTEAELKIIAEWVEQGAKDN
ncbi:MAG: c-type cytochrome domain-containing protein [Bacteroidota bacterium]